MALIRAVTHPLQARRTREACRLSRASKPTVRMPSVLSVVCPSLIPRIGRSQGMILWVARLVKSTDVSRYLDQPRLIAWLSSRQYAPEGGFSGRTNKLVDGCYSHWVGGCWPLIEASLSGPQQGFAAESATPTTEDNSLFSRNGLIRYIFCCCQDLTKRGGMRDKPSKYAHRCYHESGH